MPTEALLATIPRSDGGELRVYRKLFKGRPYIEVSSWAPETEGGQRICYLNLRRYEVRPLVLGLLEALKVLGIPLREEKSQSEAPR